MTLTEIFSGAYLWADANAMPIFAATAGLPLVGVLGAWIGKGGKTDKDGRFIANVIIGLSIIVFLLLIIGLIIAHFGFDKGMLSANALLLIGPIIGVVVALMGIRMVFPLSQLKTARLARDVGLFALLILGVLWLFSQFRGWGIVFFGSIAQMVTIGTIIFYFGRKLYRRAFKGSKEPINFDRR